MFKEEVDDDPQLSGLTKIRKSTWSSGHQEVAHDLSKTAIHEIVTEDLNMGKLWTKLVRNDLPDDQKACGLF